VNNLLKIEDCFNRYHIRDGDVERLSALEKTRRTVYERALDEAVESLNLAPEKLVCIREIHLAVSLNLSRSTHSQAGTWSECIAQEIRRLLTQGDAGSVLQFQSRGHAWIECSKSVVAGDLSASWAWQQIGLLGYDLVDSPENAVDRWIEGLCTDPAYVLPVMSALKDHAMFANLCLRITDRDWTALLMALSRQAAHDLTHIVTACAEQRAQQYIQVQFTKPAVQSRAKSSQLLSIPRTVMPAQTMSPGTQCTVALILIATTDPGFLIRRASEIKKGVLRYLESVEISADANVGDEGLDILTLDACAPSTDQKTTGLTETRTVTECDDFIVKQGESQSFVHPDTVVDSSESAAQPANHYYDNTPSVYSDDRQRATSRYGGLLFLLNLMGHPTGLCDQLASDDVFADRPMRWIWYWLGRSLVPADPGDCALLAFSGLAPNYDHTELDRISPGTEQKAVLQSAAQLLEAHACDRLALAGMQTPVALQTVFRRRAAIVVDPGWIECEFSLSDVDTAVRRAGLDLDPEYLPWLGWVVRFSYA